MVRKYHTQQKVYPDDSKCSQEWSKLSKKNNNTTQKAQFMTLIIMGNFPVELSEPGTRPGKTGKYPVRPLPVLQAFSIPDVGLFYVENKKKNRHSGAHLTRV